MLVKFADALGTSVDYLLIGNPVEDAKLGSARLYRRFQALERLAEGDCEAIIKVIDAMVIRHQTRQWSRRSAAKNRNNTINRRLRAHRVVNLATSP